MNHEQTVSLLRQVMLAAGGGLVTAGFVDDATLQTMVGALAILIASGWAIYTRRKAGLIASAAEQKGVAKVVMTNAAKAAEIPNDKVVGPSGT